MLHAVAEVSEQFRRCRAGRPTCPYQPLRPRVELVSCDDEQVRLHPRVMKGLQHLVPGWAPILEPLVLPIPKVSVLASLPEPLSLEQRSARPPRSKGLPALVFVALITYRH